TEVIRREVLLVPGDSLDLARLAENERNLRRLLFLGEPRIAVLPTDDGVELRVEVIDLYARALAPLVSGELDALGYGATAMDYNLLGTGQQVRLTAQHDPVTGNRYELGHYLPRLGRGPLAITNSLAVGDEGHDALAEVAHPFRTLEDRQAWGLQVSSHEESQRLYAAGEQSGRYRDRLDNAAAWFTGSWGDRLKIRPTLRLSLSNRRFDEATPGTVLPHDRRRFLPAVGLTLWQPRYRQTRFVHALGPLEDLQTGSWAAVLGGVSARTLGSDRTFAFLQAHLSPRAAVGRGYALASLYASGRWSEAGLYHLFLQAEGLAYLRFGAAHSLALRLRADALHRPEDEAQLLLGLDQGLRGYAPRQFDGTRRLLATAEARPTLYRGSRWVLAGALFAEAGSAWTPGQTKAEGHGTCGAGVRVGLPQVYHTPVLRGDLAWPWGRRELQVSVGIGQWF
ncbi:MAG: hypothetical protein WDA75_23625, partial [Candidatus Latescibacterota bacterium]